jgi:hypothetical protein
MNENSIYMENPDTGMAIDLRELLKDFEDKIVKLSVNYGEDYLTE